MNSSCGSKANNSIKCTVEECKFHCGDQSYCTLDCISVGAHEQNPEVCECVDCKSFSKK